MRSEWKALSGERQQRALRKKKLVSGQGGHSRHTRGGTETSRETERGGGRERRKGGERQEEGEDGASPVCPVPFRSPRSRTD